MGAEAEKIDDKKVVVKEEKSPVRIDSDDKGVLVPKNSSEEFQLAGLMLKSDALPECYKTVPQVMLATQMLRGLGFNPATAIRQTMIVNNVISIWGELPKAACQNSGELESMEELLFDKSYKTISFENKNLDAEVFGALCRVKRKGKAVVEKTFTMAEARLAGLIDKNRSLWKVYPRRMIQMRTRGFALKDEFADILSGVAIGEYDLNQLHPDERDVTQEQQLLGKSTADLINDEYGPKTQTTSEPEATQPS